jgi:hypothetical protein
VGDRKCVKDYDKNNFIGEKQVPLICRHLQYFELANASNLRRNWACELIAIKQSDKDGEVI